MIHSLKIKNFFSFKEEQEFILLGTRATSNDRRFLQTSSGYNLAKIAVLYGANGSGKTNFLRALAFLGWFVNDSWSALQAKQPILLTPFLIEKSEDTSTAFELITESNIGNIYKYKLRLTKDTVLEESLQVRKKGYKFSSIFSIHNGKYKIYNKKEIPLKSIQKIILINNASFISTLQQIHIDIFNDFLKTIKIISNIYQKQSIYNISETLKYNNIVRKYVNYYIKKYNMGISNIEFLPFLSIDQEDKTNINTKNTYGFLTVYKTDDREHNNEFLCPSTMESNGTIQLIFFLTMAFTALVQGGILVYDEFEQKIHPLLLEELLNIFYDTETNPNCSQFICTCHSAEVINSLHRRQIFLVEKNEKLESSLFCLNDIQGIKKFDDLKNRYLSGAYGGIPWL